MRCPFSRGERPVEVSSPRIVVPAIIYFLSDRGDRLYGGCSVQAPGSDDVYRVAQRYVLSRPFCVEGKFKNTNG